MNKYLITQSLLSSWAWAIKSGNTEDFLKTLSREQIVQSSAMLNGIEFERTITAIINGQTFRAATI